MKQGRFIGLGVLAMMMAAQPSLAAVKFSIAGAGSYGLNKMSVGTVEVKGDLGYGGGVLIDFGLGGTSAFQVGGIFLVNRVTATESITGISVTTSQNSVHIPGVFRLGLGRAVGINLGGYYDVSLESGGTPDYGLTGGLRFQFGGGSTNFFIDARYLMGMKEFSDIGKTKAALALIGLAFGGK